MKSTFNPSKTIVFDGIEVVEKEIPETFFGERHASVFWTTRKSSITEPALVLFSHATS